jgi:hypothetical protein
MQRVKTHQRGGPKGKIETVREYHRKTPPATALQYAKRFSDSVVQELTEMKRLGMNVPDSAFVNARDVGDIVHNEFHHQSVRDFADMLCVGAPKDVEPYLLFPTSKTSPSSSRVSRTAAALTRSGLTVTDSSEPDDDDMVDGQVNLADGRHVQVGSDYYMVYAPASSEDVMGPIQYVLEGLQNSPNALIAALKRPVKMLDQRYHARSYSGVTISLTAEEAESISHIQGRCDVPVRELSQQPHIKKMLDAMPLDTIRAVLKEEGAWDAEDLRDDGQNRQRLLWLVGLDIFDELVRDKENMIKSRVRGHSRTSKGKLTLVQSYNRKGRSPVKNYGTMLFEYLDDDDTTMHTLELRNGLTAIHRVGKYGSPWQMVDSAVADVLLDGYNTSSGDIHSVAAWASLHTGKPWHVASHYTEGGMELYPSFDQTGKPIMVSIPGPAEQGPMNKGVTLIFSKSRVQQHNRTH